LLRLSSITAKPSRKGSQRTPICPHQGVKMMFKIPTGFRSALSTLALGVGILALAGCASWTVEAPQLRSVETIRLEQTPVRSAPDEARLDGDRIEWGEITCAAAGRLDCTARALPGI
jgi:hypothetical protein